MMRSGGSIVLYFLRFFRGLGVQDSDKENKLVHRPPRRGAMSQVELVWLRVGRIHIARHAGRI